MGWIADRSFKQGGSLYDGGPKRKGPLKKITHFTAYDMDLFAVNSAWLECGHHSNNVYGEKKAICTKCKDGLPPDVEGENGWPV